MLLDSFEGQEGVPRIHFSKFAFFIQRSNDLDTVSSALALCKVLHRLQGAECRIFNVTARKSLLPGLDKFKENEKNPMIVDEDTLAVLVDVNARKQIREREWKKIEKCGQVLRIDHHEVCEPLGMKMLHKVDLTAACAELVWNMVKDAIKDEKHEFKRDVAETCFYGIYGDTRHFCSSLVNHRTFRALTEIAEITDNIPKIIKSLNRFSFPSMKLVCELMNDVVIDGHLAISNLKPDFVDRYYPYNLRRDKTGRLMQKKLITFPLEFLNKYLDVDYIIFIHFSLFDPYKSDDKVVFVVLNKENEELEKALYKYGFHKNRERFCNPEIKFSHLLAFIKDHKHLFNE